MQNWAGYGAIVTGGRTAAADEGRVATIPVRVVEGEIHIALPEPAEPVAADPAPSGTAPREDHDPAARHAASEERV